MILYDHPLSSYAQKVKIAVREKRIVFERSLPTDFGTGRRDTAFAAANPRAEVPVLLSADALARANARMTEEVCDTRYEAANRGFGELPWFRRAEGSLAETLKAETTPSRPG